MEEVIQRETNNACCHLYVESKKENKLVNITETDSQIQRTDQWLPERRSKIGVGDQEAQTTTYKISYKDVQYGEYSQYFIVNYKWSITFKNHESLRCTPVTYIVHELYFNLKNGKKQKEKGPQ